MVPRVIKKTADPGEIWACEIFGDANLPTGQPAPYTIFKSFKYSNYLNPVESPLFDRPLRSSVSISLLNLAMVTEAMVTEAVVAEAVMAEGSLNVLWICVI